MTELEDFLVTLVIAVPACLLALVSAVMVLTYPFITVAAWRSTYRYPLPDGRMVRDLLAEERAALEKMAEEQRFGPDGTDLHAELKAMRRSGRSYWLGSLGRWLVEVATFGAACGALLALPVDQFVLGGALVVTSILIHWAKTYYVGRRMKQWSNEQPEEQEVLET